MVLLLVVMAGTYVARREIARQALVGWLEERGVQAEVQLDRFDYNGLVASITAGDPNNPDFAVERAEVDYDLGMPWSGGLGVRPTRIRLIRPRLHATLEEGRLSLGSLDPILEELSRRPPSPDRASPTVIIEDGRLLLSTRGGDLVALADARMEDNRLIRLDAGIPAARLRDGETLIDLQRAGLAVRTQGDRSTLAVVSEINSWSAVGLTGQRGVVRATTQIPYPETARRRIHGPVDARLQADFDAFEWQGGAARGLDADLRFDGRGTGWIEAFALLGALGGEVSADEIETADSRLTRAALVLDGRRVRLSRRETSQWSYQGDARLTVASARRGGLSGETVALSAEDLQAGATDGDGQARSRIALTAGTLRQDALTLTGTGGQFDLVSRMGTDGQTRLSGSLRSRGGSWPVLGPVRSGDIPEQAALKRALEAFSLQADGVAVTADAAGTRVALSQPAAIRPGTGGIVRISALGGRPLFVTAASGASGGSLLIQAEGGGLPTARVEVPSYVMADSGLAAVIDGEAAFDFGLARGAALDAAGRLRIGGGRTTFEPAGCFPFRAALLDLGDNDVENLRAQICPGPGPLLTIANGWRFAGEVRDVNASVPFLGMTVTEATGPVTARDTGAGLTIDANVRDGLISDASPETRFHPMRGSGRVTLTDQDWVGALNLRDRAHGRRVADVEIHHAGRTGTGGVRFDATGLEFTPEGLQPSQISPLADGFVASPVSGRADFTGQFDWTASGASSSGHFSTPGLDFISPLGAVRQMRGEVAFTSLTPLVTAPNQRLTVQQIDAFLPLTDVSLNLGLNAASVHLEGGRIAVAGGFASLEPVDIPFDPNESWEGVLILENVQLGDIFAASSFADAVQLDAVVSGRLPFVKGPNGITIVGGNVHAVQPGRLSIARAALSGMTAGGGGEAVPPNTVQDFAYQALEHLWFDDLDAELNSLPEGRLGVLFSIHGRHDPPVEQEIRLGLVELIRRDFLNRVLPLPSGTEINLTLDSSFNLDQLVSDLLEIQRARNVSDRNR